MEKTDPYGLRVFNLIFLSSSFVDSGSTGEMDLLVKGVKGET